MYMYVFRRMLHVFTSGTASFKYQLAGERLKREQKRPHSRTTPHANHNIVRGPVEGTMMPSHHIMIPSWLPVPFSNAVLYYTRVTENVQKIYAKLRHLICRDILYRSILHCCTHPLLYLDDGVHGFSHVSFFYDNAPGRDSSLGDVPDSSQQRFRSADISKNRHL